MQRTLRRSEVESLTGLSRSSIYERVAAGTFPKPINLGGSAVGWLERELEAWLKARIEERDGLGKTKRRRRAA
ncbi:MAG: AlpA family phage regulatory protein [Xanthobacteraceae bacterium]|nr:AlpA family phage regulatory protein [Xanthobacteraceae bacterium]